MEAKQAIIAYQGIIRLSFEKPPAHILSRQLLHHTSLYLVNAASHLSVILHTIPNLFLPTMRTASV